MIGMLKRRFTNNLPGVRPADGEAAPLALPAPAPASAPHAFGRVQDDWEDDDRDDDFQCSGPDVDDDDDEEDSWDAAMAAASGGVASDSVMVNVFYHLMDRHLPAGVLERLVRDTVIEFNQSGGRIRYDNGWLARAAEHLSRQLEMAESHARGD